MTKINYSSFNDLKARNWCFLVYTDSVPKDDWVDFLIQTGAKFCVSPLHDSDIITQSDFKAHKEHFKKQGLKVGSLKKPHYHVILCFTGPTTMNFITKRVTQPLQATRPEPLISVQGMYEYIWHNPKLYKDKHEYKRSDIKRYNGFDPKDFVELTSKQTEEALDHILTHILINGYKDIAEVQTYYTLSNFPIESRVLRLNERYVKDFVNSLRLNRFGLSKTFKELDYETGEIKFKRYNPEDHKLYQYIDKSLFNSNSNLRSEVFR